MKNKSLVIVTYNREEAFKRCIRSVDPEQFDEIVIVRDGGSPAYSEKVESSLQDKFTYIVQETNKGVGVCKQAGVDYILNNTESEHIFIMEDDVLVKDNDVWDHYINFSKATGVWHTNWNDYRYSSTKFEVDFDGISGIVTRDVEGSFSYFHRNMFKFCEFPADMKNAFEHISVELQLIEKYLLPPFWNFICPKGSEEFLAHLDIESTITGKPQYTENYQNANSAFVKRHGIQVGDIKDCDQDRVFSRLKFLKENYAK